MKRFLFVCAAMIAMAWMPAGAPAGGFHGGFHGGGFAGVPFAQPFVPAIGGLGYPAFTGYYFRTWNGQTSMPRVYYPQGYFGGYYGTAVACWHPPMVWPSVAAPGAVIVSSPADPQTMTAGRFHYGGAVRFFP